MIYDLLCESIAYIKEKTELVPEIGLILGSGLGGMADKIENPCFIDYSEIPHFKSSTAPGHKGRFVIGMLCGKAVICMQGRLHFYEGYPMWNVTYPVRCMKLLGAEKLILTNACGSLNENISVGDFVMIKDHINYLGTNPLIGENEKEFGPRFFDMGNAYDKELRELAVQCAKKAQIDLKEGIFLAYSGPSYETPAEIRMFHSWGADTVGMSVVPESIVAAHCSMKVLAISCITNMAAGITDQKLSEDEVIEIASKRGPDFERLITEIIEAI